MNFCRTLKDDPPQLAEINRSQSPKSKCRGAQASRSWAAGRRLARLRWSLPTPAPATNAGMTSEIRRTGATDIHSPIVPIAVRDTPSFAIYRMTARRRRCPLSPCALTARRNIKIPTIGAFMPSQMRAPFVAHRWPWWKPRGNSLTEVSFAARDSLPMIRQTRGLLLRRARLLRSRGWADFCWPAMRPMMRRSRSCEDASGARTSPSR